MPDCFSNVQVLLPFELTSAVEGDRQVIRVGRVFFVGNDPEGYANVWSESTGEEFDASSLEQYVGQEVVKIDGVPTFDSLLNSAITEEWISKDPAANFNYMLQFDVFTVRSLVRVME